jgi:excisionase family DNA binding protein
MTRDGLGNTISAESDSTMTDGKPAPTPNLYSVPEAARRLNLPVTWLYERTRKNAIPCHRFGKYVRFTDSDLDAIIAAGSSEGK